MRISFATVGVFVGAAVLSAALPAQAAEPTATPPAATASTSTAAPKAAQADNSIKPTRFVLRNATDKTMDVWAPDGGQPRNKTEHHVAHLTPGTEFAIEGSNSGAYDVYLRIKVEENTGKWFVPFKAVVGASNPALGDPYVFAGAGSYSRGFPFNDSQPYRASTGLSEHETVSGWSIASTNFKAWIHRDADSDGRKIMKMTIGSLDMSGTVNSDKF